MHNDLAALGRRPEDTLSRSAIASDAPRLRRVRPRGGRRGPQYGIFFPITAAGARLGTVVLGYSRAAARAEIARARREIVLGLGAGRGAGRAARLPPRVVRLPPDHDDRGGHAERVGRGGEGRPRRGKAATRSAVLASSFNKMAEDLSRHRKHLNELVEARTAELRDANVRLEVEIAERRRVEDELRRSRTGAARPGVSPAVGAGAGADGHRPRDPRRAGAGPDRAEDGPPLGGPAGRGRATVGGRQGSARCRRRSTPPSRRCDASRRSCGPSCSTTSACRQPSSGRPGSSSGASGVACRIRSEPDDIVLDHGPLHGALPDLPGDADQRRAPRAARRGWTSCSGTSGERSR